VLSEAWRDVLTGTSRVCAVTIALTLTMLLSWGADAFVLARLVAGARVFQDSGAATYVLVAPGRVAADACDRLGSVAGVVDAGGLRTSATTLTPLRLPGTNLPVHDGTPGLVAALDPDTGAGTGLGVLVPGRVAEHLGLAPGDELLTTTGTTPVRGVYDYPDDGRRTGLGYAVLAPARAVGLVDECRITVWPPSEERLRLLWSTLRDGAPAAGEIDEPRVQQLNTTLGPAFPGSAEHDARVSRFAPLIAGSVAAAVGVVSIRRRRLELAGIRHLGCSRSALLAQMLIESTIATLAAAALTTAVAVLLLASPVGADDPGALARVAATCIVLAGCGHLAGVGAATLSTRERQLFRYFRHR
jgi:hypothetical protein